MDGDFAWLKLQFEWGADEAIADEPLDRLRPLEPVGQGQSLPGRPSAAGYGAANPAGGPASVVPGGFPPPGAIGGSGASYAPNPEPALGTPAERALGLAGRAGTLDELRAAIAAFDGCALRDTASNLVFAEGDPSSTTLIIGEAPGREEDRSGHPFAGPEGDLLDRMLASIGVKRAEMMLTPLLPWRPPGGRPVNTGELTMCLPFLHRLVALLEPKRIVIFGPTAVRALLTQAGVRRKAPRGWIETSLPGVQIKPPAMALPGLPELIKNPPLRKEAWAGLRLLRRALDEEQTQT